MPARSRQRRAIGPRRPPHMWDHLDPGLPAPRGPLRSLIGGTVSNHLFIRGSWTESRDRSALADQDGFSPPAPVTARAACTAHGVPRECHFALTCYKRIPRVAPSWTPHASGAPGVPSVWSFKWGRPCPRARPPRPPVPPGPGFFRWFTELNRLPRGDLPRPGSPPRRDNENTLSPPCAHPRPPAPCAPPSRR